MQELVPGGRFDVIKLDVEGEEVTLLADAASRPVLCAALCIALELHERFAPGADAAYAAFLRDGCPGASSGSGGHGGFVELALSGEYLLICQRELLAGAAF